MTLRHGEAKDEAANLDKDGTLSGIRQGEMPPLFVIGPAGGSELVNYRVRANYYIVDRLFGAAELRLGDKDSERRVRIVRTDGRPRS